MKTVDQIRHSFTFAHDNGSVHGVPSAQLGSPRDRRKIPSMFKKDYVLAVVSFLLIPAVVVAGGMLIISINPEIAAGYPNYARNFWLLNLVKKFFMLAVFLASMGLWFLTCFFLVKSKQQSYAWLVLAIFDLVGFIILTPVGFIILTMLRDKAPALGDLHQQFVGNLKLYLRVAYELCFFVLVWVVAYQSMVLKRDLMIMYEAAVTGMSTAQIIDQQNASGGMWAFSEGNEVLYLVVLFYLLWPICFNVVGHLPKLGASTKKA
jgi:hypothetical protein